MYIYIYTQSTEIAGYCQNLHAGCLLTQNGSERKKVFVKLQPSTRKLYLLILMYIHWKFKFR